MALPVAAVELRTWGHNLESQEIKDCPCTSEFDPESDRCPDTGRKTQMVYKVDFSFSLLMAVLLMVIKKKHTGPFRTSHQPWVGNCVYGMRVMELEEVNGCQSLSTTGLARPSAICFASCWNAHGFAKRTAAPRGSLEAYGVHNLLMVIADEVFF